MNQKLTQLYKMARALHASVSAASSEIDGLVKNSVDSSEQADAAYALRETAKWLDESRKQLEAHRKLAERMACIIETQLERAGPIRTDYCTATTDVKTVVNVPRRSTDPEGFERLMRYLDVPDHCWRGGDHAAVVPHWPGLVELLTARLAEGRPLPDGIDPNRTWPEYKLVIRGKIAPDGEGPVSAAAAVRREGEEVPF